MLLMDDFLEVTIFGLLLFIAATGPFYAWDWLERHRRSTGKPRWWSVRVSGVGIVFLSLVCLPQAISCADSRAVETHPSPEEGSYRTHSPTALPFDEYPFEDRETKEFRKMLSGRRHSSPRSFFEAQTAPAPRQRFQPACSPAFRSRL